LRTGTDGRDAPKRERQRGFLSGQIIAILAAILFPVFSRAREKARQTSCLSNLKQLGLGFMMYAQDYDETLPGTSFGSGVYPWNQWPNSVDWCGVFTHAIQPYIKNQQLLQCPSDTESDRWSGANGISYAYNEFLYNYDNGFCKLSRANQAPAGPAGISMVLESYASGIYNNWDTSGPQPLNADGMARVRYGGWSPYASHHDGTNITYGDGHSKFMPENRIVSYVITSGWSDLRERPVVYPACVEP